MYSVFGFYHIVRWLLSLIIIFLDNLQFEFLVLSGFSWVILDKPRLFLYCLGYLFLFSLDGKRSTSSSGSDSSFKNRILESGILYSGATVFSNDHLTVEFYSLFLLFMEYLPVVRWPVCLWSPSVCWTDIRTMGFIGLRYVRGLLTYFLVLLTLKNVFLISGGLVF